MLKLLDIINDIMEFKGDLQNNVVLNNTLPPMVRIQAFRLTQKILSHIPRVKNRVRTIQKGINDRMVATLSKNE